MLSYLTYIGHAADGIFANYRAAAGVNADGVADGFVTGTFALPAGEYSVLIGGADHAAQGPSPYPSFGITPTITVVPEPSSSALVIFAGGLLAFRNRSGYRTRCSAAG